MSSVAAQPLNLADLPAVLTVEEAGRALRLGRGAAYDAVRRGEIPSVRLGRSIRIPRARLLELLGEAPESAEPAVAGSKARRELNRAREYHRPPQAS
jgi:excisionase family DNA binding protein